MAVRRLPVTLPVAGVTTELAKSILAVTKNRICCTCRDTVYMPNCTDFLGLVHLQTLSQQKHMGASSFPKTGLSLSGVKRAVQLKHTHSACWTRSDPEFGIKCPTVYTAETALSPSLDILLLWV